MRAIEVTGSIDKEGNLAIDQPIPAIAHSRVRVIILVSELEEANDPDDTPVEVVKESLQRALQQAKSGQRIPLSQMWEGIETE